MKHNTILVLANPNEAPIGLLDKLRADNEIFVGDSAESMKSAAPNANIIFNWSGSLDLLRTVFRMCPKLQWVHSRSAGLERTLFAELVEGDVILTNGSGVFSPSLGEFV